MSFEIQSVQGTVDELVIDLSVPSQHQREEFVIEEIKKAVDHVITALGGYLSVSVNGNINPVSGENGDLVNIYITSLSAPTSAPTAPVETPEIPAGISPESPPVTVPVETPEEGATREAHEAAEKEAEVSAPAAGEVGQEIPQINETGVQQETAPSEPPAIGEPGEVVATEGVVPPVSTPTNTEISTGPVSPVEPENGADNSPVAPVTEPPTADSADSGVVPDSIVQ